MIYCYRFLAFLGLLPLLCQMLVPGMCGTALGASATNPDSVEFDFQSIYTGPHTLNAQGLKPWTDSLIEQSGGRLRPNFLLGDSRFRQDELVPALVAGRLDSGAGGISYQDALFPYAQALMLPYLVEDSRHAAEMFWTAYETLPEIKAELEKVGKVLMVWGSDRSGIFSTTGPIRSPADVKGKRVIVWNSGLMDQVKAWGGVPVQINPSDTFEAMQRGQGELFLGPLPAAVANHLRDVAKSVTILPASAIPVVVWMNKKMWDKLPPDLQQIIIRSSGREASKRFGQMLYEATNRNLVAMDAAGLEVIILSPAQREAFQQADMPSLMEFWQKNLARLKVNNPDDWITRVYGLARATENTDKL